MVVDNIINRRSVRSCPPHLDAEIHVINWNDMEGRTVEEVLKVLDEAIQAMEIGTEQETVIIEPVESPVPVEAPVEEPVETPEPVLVPA
jgi:hypothetical protein